MGRRLKEVLHREANLNGHVLKTRKKAKKRWTRERKKGVLSISKTEKKRTPGNRGERWKL